MMIPSIQRSAIDPEPPSEDRVWVSLYQQDGQYVGTPFIYRTENGDWVVTR